MSYFSRHLFFCVNERAAGEGCCQEFDAQKARDYVKAKVKTLGLDGPGGVRVNASGCLGRCEKGPVVVIYPEGVWYTYVDREDLDEIVESHIQKGSPVERLRI